MPLRMLEIKLIQVSELRGLHPIRPYEPEAGLEAELEAG